MFPTQGLQNSQIDSHKKSNAFYLSTARFYRVVPRVYSFYAFIQQLLMPFLPSHPIEKVLSINIIWAPKCSNHRSWTINNRIIIESSYVSKPGPSIWLEAVKNILFSLSRSFSSRPHTKGVSAIRFPEESKPRVASLNNYPYLWLHAHSKSHFKCYVGQIRVRCSPDRRV